MSSASTIESFARTIGLVERGLRSVLEEPSRRALYEVASQLKGSGDAWAYEVYPKQPLRFKPTIIDRIQLQADIICDIAGNSATSPILTRQNLVVRVWSLDSAVSYRSNMDSMDIQEQLAKQDYRRVMLRYHFDEIISDQNGPDFHLQVGGSPEYEEFCWLHKSIGVPRIAFPPMDLILACELVTANFFPDLYFKLKNDPEWMSAVQKSEDLFQRPYFESRMNMLNAREGSRADTLLSSCWRFRIGP
jgi:hypothetical protein